MDIDTFEREYYDTEEITGLICPNCQDGKLVIHKKNVSFIEYREKVQGYNGYDDNCFKYSFYGFLKCNSCLEKIVFAGKASPDFEYNNADEELAYFNDLKIEYIERPPYIINVNKSIPNEIKEVLINSFKLYWIDINSCANKVRICIELLMDLFKVKKYKIIKNKRKLLNLHERITLFAGDNQYIKNLLTSIKWISNFASHNDTIDKEDILDLYFLLESVINKIFCFDEIEAQKISREINKIKKPRAKIEI